MSRKEQIVIHPDRERHLKLLGVNIEEYKASTTDIEIVAQRKQAEQRSAELARRQANRT